MKFPCNGCGACCRRVWMVGQEELEKHGLATKEDGSCIHLSTDNSCEIYDDRPDICNVEKQSELSTLPQWLYYEQTIELCNKWMIEDNVKKTPITL